jgi:hypothetical protein
LNIAGVIAVRGAVAISAIAAACGQRFHGSPQSGCTGDHLGVKDDEMNEAISRQR